MAVLIKSENSSSISSSYSNRSSFAVSLAAWNWKENLPVKELRKKTSELENQEKKTIF